MPKPEDPELADKQKGWRTWLRDLDNAIEEWPSTYLGLYGQRVFTGESNGKTEIQPSSRPES